MNCPLFVPLDYDVEIYDGRTPFLLMTQDMIHHRWN